MRPSSLTARVCGFAMSCSSAPKRSAVAARQLVGERLREQRRDRRAVLLAEGRGRVALERDRLASTASVWR